METKTDPQTAARLKGEFEKVRAALQGQTAITINDPLGEDGEVTVQTNSWRQATGAGEVVWLVGDTSGDHRYVRFRSWGPNGTDFLEKTAFLKKENGVTEFHKRRIEPGDKVVYTTDPEPDDKGWLGTLT